MMIPHYISIYINSALSCTLNQKLFTKAAGLAKMRARSTVFPRMIATLMLLPLIPHLVSTFVYSSTQVPSIESFLGCLSRNSPSPITTYTQNSTAYTDLYQTKYQNPRVLTSPSSLPPLLIIIPSKEIQVQATVTCCRRNGLHLRVRSGGHDYEGLSYVSNTPFVMLDLANFASIAVNITDDTAWVQAGALLRDLYGNITQKSATKSFPSGWCPTVGTGGQFSGGGIGSLMRKYGLAADNILDAHLVDSNGRLLDRRSMGEDLFWALRGGGAASYGVLLSYKIRLVYVPPKVTIFSINKTLEQGAAELVSKWQEVAATVDRNLYIRLILQGVGFAENRTVQALFDAIYQGTTMELLPLITKSFPELGVKRQDCREVTYNEALNFYAEFISILSDVKPSFKGKSDFVKTNFPITAFQGMWDLLKEDVVGLLSMEPLGGKMEDILESESPFPHRRGNLHIIQYGVIILQDSDADWINKMYSYMAPYVSNSPRTAYLNFRDIDLGRTDKDTSYLQASSSWGSKYFKNNFRRLALAKAKTDRSNFFRNEQSIPPLF